MLVVGGGIGGLSATLALRRAGVAVDVPRLLHGYERTVWAMLDEAAGRGYDVRIGLEDTLERPDGGRAEGNEELVRFAVGRATR